MNSQEDFMIGIPPDISISNNEIVNDISQVETTPPRAKLYPSFCKGPFTVYFRKIDKPINILLISSKIYEYFKSVKEIKQISLHKLRIIFNDREEANNLVQSSLFSNFYRIYIPCDIVEINGIVYDEALSPDYIVTGTGVFKNKSIANIRVLQSKRLFTDISKSDIPSFIPSNAIPVTFEGTALPDFLCVDNVLFRVKLFLPKVMHCDRCQLFGRTSKFCNNKIKCAKCSENHFTTSCSKPFNICSHYNKIHSNFKDCSLYESSKTKLHQKITNRSRFSYADLLKKNSSNIISPNSFEVLNNMDSNSNKDSDPSCSYVPPPKRKMLRQSNSTTRIENSTFLDNINFPPLKSNEPNIIPGFQKVSADNNLNSSSKSDTDDFLLSKIEEILTLFGVDDSWKKLLKLIFPFISKIISSFMPLFANIFSSNGSD